MRTGYNSRGAPDLDTLRSFIGAAVSPHLLGTPIDPASSPALALGGAVQPRPGPTASHSTPSLTARPSATDLPANPTSPQTRAPSPRAPLAVSYPAISLTTATVGRHRCPQKRLQTAANLPSTRIRARTIASVTSSPPSAVLTPSLGVHRWIRAKN